MVTDVNMQVVEADQLTELEFPSGAMWARDIFETFFKKDTTDKTAARRLRDLLLKPGASQNEWKTLTGYLGREPRPDALLRWYGITKDS